MSNVKDTKKKTIPKDLLCVLDGKEEEEEIFTPDKENFSPNTLQLLFLKKKGKLEEIKHSKSKRSHNLKDTFSSGIYPNESRSLIQSKRIGRRIRQSQKIFSPFWMGKKISSLQIKKISPQPTFDCGF
ncbi:hypothetical protein Lalb_Chr24g0401071 [Lupinus albus]|uniref:Uncharacterized protein n=1 Tax=Lupinus albus TaxID=3870 RepID=A0A6A4N9P3_LUPAL|nr:hypothetical protein Lalb_Chr24g0401071 [Lupinus albus]